VEFRAALLEEEYRSRRERYAAEATRRGLVYRPEDVALRTAERLRGLSIEPRRAELGQVHTLVFVPIVSWHSQLLPSLGQLGPISHFDYTAHGIDPVALCTGGQAAAQARRRVAQTFEEFAIAAHRRTPLNWIFIYGTGYDMLADSVQRVRSLTGAPVVGMCFDDKQSWEVEWLGEQYAGQWSLAPHFDLAWTSSRVACEWYMVEGGNPIYLPEGCDPDLFRADTNQDLDLSFIGQAYGFRASFVRGLERGGLRVNAHGQGWPGGSVSFQEMVTLLARSKIILGHGGIGWSASLKNIKGRDFDGPCAGSGAYLTSYHPELADFFRIGEEIVCYSSPDECIELARWLLADDPRRRAIARAGRERCLREHTWLHRFKRILQTLGVLASSTRC
jgi:hypothetical protein